MAFAASGPCGNACRTAAAGRDREPSVVTPREPHRGGREVRWSRTPILWLVAWTRFVRRHSIAVLAFSLVSAVLAGAYAAKNVSINTSTADMLSEDLPFQRQFEALDRAFPQDYRTIVVVVDGDTPEQARTAAERLAERLAERPDVIRNVFHPEADPFFRRHGLLYLSVEELQTLGSMLAGAQPLLAALAQDPSLRGLSQVLTLALRNIDRAGTADGHLPPQFEAALQGITGTVEEVEAGHPARFSWRGALAGDADPRFAGTRQYLLLEPSFDFNSLQPAERAITLIRSTAADLQLTPERGIRVRLTGEPVMMEEELKSVEESIGVANLLSLGIVVTLLIIGLRSIRLVEAATFSLLVGLAWTACFAVATVGQLNLISVAFAVLFIGFGVDFGIHFCMRAKEYIDADLGTGLALEEAAAGVAPGLTLTTISASIGFLAFLPTDYKGLVELGIISSAGMVVALATSLSIVPAYISVRTPRKSDARQQRAIGTALERVLGRRARSILWGALALGALGAATLPFARFDDSPLDLRDPKTEGVSTLFDLLRDARFDPFRAAVLARDPVEAEEIAAKLRTLPEVRRVETVGDLVPDRQDEKLAMLGDLALMLTPVLSPGEQRPPPDSAELLASLSELREAAMAEAARSPGARRLAEALGRFEPTTENLAQLQTALLANLPPMLMELIESLNAGEVTLADVPPTLLARRQTAEGQVLVEVFPKAEPSDQAGRRRFAAAVQAVVPAASGEAIAITEGGRAVIRSFYQAGIFTFALITLLLLVVLRSVGDSLMVMAPLILAGLLTVATTVIIDVPFNFANVIVLPLLFGLGVSSGINMAVRGRQQGSRSLLVTSTPKAVLFSALTTIGSFGSLALSTHPGMASMGLLLTAALTYTTLCTLIVLPALRHVFGPSSRS
jgi:hopanoid biosynthesis associated RND transporter like protein HpnN